MATAILNFQGKKAELIHLTRSFWGSSSPNCLNFSDILVNKGVTLMRAEADLVDPASRLVRNWLLRFDRELAMEERPPPTLDVAKAGCLAEAGWPTWKADRFEH